MSGFWQWQDDALWGSASAGVRAEAESLIAQAPAHFSALEQLAAMQPLTSDAGVTEAVREAAALGNIAPRLVVIGTGGASLGAQTLCALSADPSRVQFLENCDPVTLDRFFAGDAQDTAWCIISKSGETVETLAAALALAGRYRAEDLKARVRVITGAQQSTLSRLARAQGWAMLEHPATLGGRYSVFSVVGLLPAAFAGLPVKDIAASAAASMQTLQQKDAQLMAHAAWFIAHSDKPVHLLMGYADRLRAATQWYKQLWAESLGKDGKGPTPVTAIGAIDQHSQLQLYLDGPRDKLVTLWLPEVRGTGMALPDLQIGGAEFLRGHTMGDVMQATAEATVSTMIEAGVPLRVLRGKLTPESLAAWMARQMLETLLVAHLMGVDPYSQPAVEAGKKLTRAALAGGAP